MWSPVTVIRWRHKTLPHSLVRNGLWLLACCNSRAEWFQKRLWPAELKIFPLALSRRSVARVMLSLPDLTFRSVRILSGSRMQVRCTTDLQKRTI